MAATNRQPSRMWGFLLELRHRKVCRAAAVYTLTVWLGLQIAEILVPALMLPEWTLGLLLLLGLLGFPVALVLAWMFEITPQGLAIDVPRARPGPGKRSTRRVSILDCGLLLVAALISLQLLLEGFRQDVFAIEAPETMALADIRSVTVVPFESAGASAESAALSQGVTDELRHLLRAERGMTIIVWSPTRDTPPVVEGGALLEGSVNVGAQDVRVNVRIVDPKSGRDLWSAVTDVPRDAPVAMQRNVAAEILATIPLRPALDLPVTAVAVSQPGGRP